MTIVYPKGAFPIHLVQQIEMITVNSTTVNGKPDDTAAILQGAYSWSVTVHTIPCNVVIGVME